MRVSAITDISLFNPLVLTQIRKTAIDYY